jgi:hypothetical protein
MSECQVGEAAGSQGDQAYGSLRVGIWLMASTGPAGPSAG